METRERWKFVYMYIASSYFEATIPYLNWYVVRADATDVLVILWSIASRAQLQSLLSLFDGLSFFLSLVFRSLSLFLSLYKKKK